MNKKNIIIITLLIITSVLFCGIKFYIIPQNEKKEEQYLKEQADSLTHDIKLVEKYKSKYIGDNSNTINLFNSLPLNDVSKDFKIDPDECSLTVNYKEDIWNLGEEKVQRDLVYNAIISMASIDNLSKVTYNFSNNKISFTRKKVESILGSDLSSLLEKDVWKDKVQKKLNSEEFVNQFY